MKRTVQLYSLGQGLARQSPQLLFQSDLAPI